MNLKRHIFEFIADHHSRLDYLPTLAEIRKAFAGLSDELDLHLEQLQHEGLLRFGGTEDDSVSIPHTFPPARRIELRNASVSKSILTSEGSVDSSITLDLRGAGVAMDGDLYAQIITDNSMIDAGMALGDVAILKAASPMRGDIVALEEEGRSVLRRYIVVAGIPHFLAENPVRPDLQAAIEKPIHGVLWCLIRTKPSARTAPALPLGAISYQHRSTTLEAEFMTMLQQALKELPDPPKPFSRKGSTSNARGGSVTKNASTKKRRVRHDPEKTASSQHLGLNDEGSSDYRAFPVKPVLDERPDRAYGSAFTEALQQFMAREQITPSREPSVTTPAP